MSGMNAIIYTRVSTTEQADEGTSLTTQEAQCREWCAKHEYTVDKLFSDAGESAKTSDRPQFLALMNYCAKAKPAVCVVWKFDRWARNSTDHAVASATIGKHGVRLVSVTEAASDDPAGRLLTTILSGIAQFDNEVRAERAKMSMHEIAKRGGWCGYAPYGFFCARAGLLPILAEDPEHAPIVRDLFDGLASRRRTLMQTISIGKELGIKGHTLRQMLRKPIYAAIIRGKLTGYKDTQAAFPGLVSVETFNLAQQSMDGRKNPIRKARPEWPLRCLLKCPVCGGAVTACWTTGHGGKYEYYQCTRSHVRGSVKAVHAQLEKILEGMSTEFLPIVQDIREEVKRVVKERIEIASKIEKNGLDESDRLRARRMRLNDLYEAGRMPFNDYLARDTDLKDRMDKYLDMAHRKMDWSYCIEDAMFQCCRLLRKPVAMWNAFDLAGKQRMIEVLFGGDLYLSETGTLQTSKSAGIYGGLEAIKAAKTDMVGLVSICTNLSELISRLKTAA